MAITPAPAANGRRARCLHTDQTNTTRSTSTTTEAAARSKVLGGPDSELEPAAHTNVHSISSGRVGRRHLHPAAVAGIITVMCGRFTLRTPASILATRFRVETMPELFPRYNVAPTQQSLVIRAHEPATAAYLRWGLIPSWAKEPQIGARMINARCETVAEKPAFRTAFKRRRCLVPTDGYFEWLTVGREKRPQYIRMRDERPFAMAGLWERWDGPKGARRTDPIETFTVITTESNDATSAIHERMPLILADDDWDLWLDPALQTHTELARLLRPYPSAAMKVDRVSTRVNNVRYDDPQCIEILRELF